MSTAPSRPRVAHVVLDLHEGGLERLVVDLAKGMQDFGYDSRVFCLRRRGQLADELGPDDVAVIPPQGGIVGMLWPTNLAHHLQAFGATVVHGHSGAFFKTMRAARMQKLPVLLTDHGRPHPDPMASRILDGLAARGASRTIAVSEPLRRYMSSELLVPSGRLDVIRNGVRPFRQPAADVVAAARSDILRGGGPLIGSVGRLDRVKAYDVLIRAVAQLSARWAGPVVPHLVLVGDGPDRARLEALIDELAVREHVTLAGWRSDVRPILSALDVFVLSSDSEGTSVSLLEAMQAERAIVATRVGGNPDVLGPELAGQLVPPQDVTSLSEALETVLRSAELRATIGTTARLRVTAAYSQQSMLAGYAACYGALTRTH